MLSSRAWWLLAELHQSLAGCFGAFSFRNMPTLKQVDGEDIGKFKTNQLASQALAETGGRREVLCQLNKFCCIVIFDNHSISLLSPENKGLVHRLRLLTKQSK